MIIVLNHSQTIAIIAGIVFSLGFLMGFVAGRWGNN